MNLTIVTLTTGDRPELLAHNVESVARWAPGAQHVVYQDPEPTYKRGRANELIGHPDVTRRILGDYVYQLDDDDILIGDPTLPEGNDAWFMFYAFLGHPLQSYFPKPFGEEWQPEFGKVSSLNSVIRADVWREHIGAYAGVERGGDYRFVQAIWDAGHRPVFIDRCIARTQVISGGAAHAAN